MIDDSYVKEISEMCDENKKVKYNDVDYLSMLENIILISKKTDST
jgi:hypothetical protein